MKVEMQSSCNLILLSISSMESTSIWFLLSKKQDDLYPSWVRAVLLAMSLRDIDFIDSRTDLTIKHAHLLIIVFSFEEASLAWFMGFR